jgi:hypothetical protein
MSQLFTYPGIWSTLASLSTSLGIFNESTNGLAPSTGSVSSTSTYYLNATGTWTTPAGGGGGVSTVFTTSANGLAPSTATVSSNPSTFFLAGNATWINPTFLYVNSATATAPSTIGSAWYDTTRGTVVMLLSNGGKSTALNYTPQDGTLAVQPGVVALASTSTQLLSTFFNPNEFNNDTATSYWKWSISFSTTFGSSADVVSTWLICSTSLNSTLSTIGSTITGSMSNTSGSATLDFLVKITPASLRVESILIGGLAASGGITLIDCNRSLFNSFNSWSTYLMIAQTGNSGNSTQVFTSYMQRLG